MIGPRDAPRERFAGHVLRLRGRSGLTQGQVAERVNVHVRSIQLWEAGASHPNAQRLRALLEVFLNAGAFGLEDALVDAEASLERGLDVLSTTELDLPERHRSMTAILDSALAQVPDADRVLVTALGREHGRRDESASGTGASLTLESLSRVRLLREHALVTVASDGRGPTLHPLLRTYLRGGTVTRRR